jgi:iron complex transport system ATP-binding protein
VSGLLEARELSVRIGDTTVCHGLDLTIHAGESWALLGRNGTGKTTLLLHLAGLLPTQAGTISLVDGPLHAMTPRARARRVALLLQHSGSRLGASVLETVLGGRHPHLATLAWEGPADLAIARQSLAAMGLTEFEQRSLETLSGGELRRVEIARLLTQQCPLSLLDEPLNHLDLAHQAACLQVLGTQCVSPQRAMLMVVHDLNVAYHACGRWLLLDGAGGWHAGTRESLSDPQLLSRIYAHSIMRIETADGPVFQPGHLVPGGAVTAARSPC